MLDRSMQGVYPIIATPFDNQDGVCVEDLQREADFIAAAGAPGIGNANNSEITLLTEDERDVVLKTSLP